MSVPVYRGAVAQSSYREWAPPARLAASVLCGWAGSGGWDREVRVLPDGCADLVWDGTVLTVTATGAAPTRVAVRAGVRSRGLRLRPGAAGHLLRHPVDGIATVALTELWGAEGRRWEERLAAGASLEALAAERLDAAGEGDRRVARAVALLTAGLAVRQVAEHLAIHPTGLRRLLHSHVGLGPKALQGVTRFQRFVASLGRLAGARTTLAALAAELGYADQAHLSREVRRLAGASPGSVLETFKTARDGGATVGAWRSSTSPSGSTTSTPTATCEAPRT